MGNAGVGAGGGGGVLLSKAPPSRGWGRTRPDSEWPTMVSGDLIGRPGPRLTFLGRELCRIQAATGAMGRQEMTGL